MKNLKRSALFFLAVLLVLSLLVPALSSFADEEEVLIEKASEWEYVVFEESGSPLTAAEPDGWLDKTDSAAWQTAQAPFAAPTWAKEIANTLFDFQLYSAFLRKTVNLENVDGINALTMDVIYDEAPRLYINGTPVWSKGDGVYHDSDYERVDLSDHTDALKEGENVICVFFCNVYGGGIYDMSLTVGRGEKTPVEPPAPVDDEGHVTIKEVTTTGFTSFGAINDPANVLDMDQNTVTGSAYNGGAEQSVTLVFNERTAISEIFVQCKDEGSTTAVDGYTRGDYRIYAFDGDLENDLGEIKAVTGSDGGATLTLDKPVYADSVKIVISTWQGDCWACVADAYVVASDAEPGEEPTSEPSEETPSEETPSEETPLPTTDAPTESEQPTSEPTPSANETSPAVSSASDPVISPAPKTALPGWAIALIAAGALATVAVVVVIVIVNAKKKK